MMSQGVAKELAFPSSVMALTNAADSPHSLPPLTADVQYCHQLRALQITEEEQQQDMCRHIFAAQEPEPNTGPEEDQTEGFRGQIDVAATEESEASEN
jgi:hypothetical protein